MTSERTKAPLAPQGPAGLFAPLVLARPTDILPHSYVVHTHSQKCSACNSLHEWSELYAWNRLRPRLGQGKSIDNLIKVDAFMYNVPILHHRTALRAVPCCFECLDTISLEQFPTLEATEAWQETLRRKEAEAARINEPKPPKPPAGPKAPLTTKQVLDLI